MVSNVLLTNAIGKILTQIIILSTIIDEYLKSLIILLQIF